MKTAALVMTATVITAMATGCSSSSRMAHPGAMGGPLGRGMMSGSSHYHPATLSCSAPAALPGQVVHVDLLDMGMSRPMTGAAPLSGHMRIEASTTHVPAGRVSVVAANLGWRTHELVILRLSKGVAVGSRAVGADGRVSETGSVGEASRSCGPGAGEGIASGAVGWTTVTLAPGRYEIVCNLRNHYADGMHTGIVVS